MAELSGKVALVTGGASGIGRAAAGRLAGEGALVAVADRNHSEALAAQEEIERAGGRCQAFLTDVSHSSEVAATVAQVLAAFGRIDVLVHCAGVSGGHASVMDMSDDEWRSVLGINLDGTFYVCREVARSMAEQRDGTIVIITSDRGQLGQRRGANYASSKGGQIALMKSLALELGPLGVTVNSINPGATNTPLTRDMDPELRHQRLAHDPLGRMSEPEDIAETVLFLASRGGKYMTGQVVTTRMR